MTIDSNTPDVVSSLATQLAASAAFVAAGGTAAKIYYPRIDWSSSVTFAAVLTHTGRGVSRPFVGVTLPNGELEIELYSTKTVAELETLAHAIAAQVCTDIGIENLIVTSIGLAEEPDDAEGVNTSLNKITIGLSYGLD